MEERVTLRAGTVWTRFEGSPSLLRFLSEQLVAERKGARFSRKPWWDGKVKFVNLPLKQFPTGLVPRVRRLFEAEGLPVPLVVLDYPLPPKLTPFCAALAGPPLRPYQAEAATTALGRGRLALQVGTGGGKTRIGAEILRRFGLGALWIVHTKDLLYQVHSELTKMLERPIGLIGDGKVELPSGPNPVVVGIVNSLKRLPDTAPLWSLFKVVTLDECQFASNETWYEVALNCQAALFRIALSGTVKTGDAARDLRLEGMTGPLVIAAGGSEPELIDQGFLARPTIVMLRPSAGSYPSPIAVRDAVCPNWRKNPRQLRNLGAKMYAEAYRRGVTQNADRSALVLETAVEHARSGARVLLMCTRLEHGEVLFDTLCRAGIPAWWLSGKESSTKRQAAVDAFRHCNGGVLVASKIFDAGVDIPEIDVLILAGAGESTNLTFQRVGRALRKRDDKDEVLIYDVADGATNDPKDHLAKHTKTRITDYQSKGYAVRGEGTHADEFWAFLSRRFRL